jgi:hypothetical protein
MRTTFLATLLVGVMTVGGPMASGQEKKPSAPRFQVSSTDLAVTYSTENAKVTPSTNGSFWLQGGSLDDAATFFHNFGVAANVTGDHASNIAPGVNLNKIAFMIGPRYTRRVPSKRESRVFVEALAGGVRGFGSIFPLPTGTDSHASSFAFQAGGGLDIAISKHLALRAIEADYVRTYLPNNGTNTQDHLRLAFGVTYHTQKH